MTTTTTTLTKMAALIAVLMLALTGCSGEEETEGPSVSFEGVEDGDTVSSPVSLEFEADDFEIIPADAGNQEDAGHMHIMIDTPCVDPGTVIPNDDSHRHFGDGSDETELELEPGEHTLCLQAGDANHTALDVTDEITITVE